MTPRAALLEELRLLRAMGDGGRAAAARALKSARLGRRPENPATLPGDDAVASVSTGGLDPHGAAASTDDDDAAMKFLVHTLDSAIVERGGGSIFATKARGTLSAEAEARLQAWALETPRIHPDTTGVKPKDPPLIGPLVPKPGPRRVLPGQPLPPLPEGFRWPQRKPRARDEGKR